MFRLKAARNTRWYALGVMLGCAVAVLHPGRAQAHFILVAPDSWMSQSALGLPEKLGPCGDEGGGTPTGTVTAFHPGQTIAVTINEVITHPGHYRVALSVNSRSELPPEPLVTPTASDPCASAAIESPPTFPILADNVLPHTQDFGAPQTFSVTLPGDVTCTKCTLQVLEFMSNHTAPCFYHHCADISIQEAPSATETPTPIGTPAPTPTSTPSASATGTPTATPTVLPCVGDCDRNGAVTIDELATGIGMIFGDVPLRACPAFDARNEGWVTVSALVLAIDNSSSGCPGNP